MYMCRKFICKKADYIEAYMKNIIEKNFLLRIFKLKNGLIKI